MKFYKIHITTFIAMGLSALVLLSSGGLSVDSHYCQGHLKSVALIGKARNCHEMTSQKVCEHHVKVSTNLDDETSRDCCENRTTLIKSDIELFYSPISIEQEQLLILVAAVPVLDELVFDRFESRREIRDRAPPPRFSTPLYSLNQSFLL